MLRLLLESQEVCVLPRPRGGSGAGGQRVLPGAVSMEDTGRCSPPLGVWKEFLCSLVVVC